MPTHNFACYEMTDQTVPCMGICLDKGLMLFLLARLEPDWLHGAELPSDLSSSPGTVTTKKNQWSSTSCCLGPLWASSLPTDSSGSQEAQKLWWAAEMANEGKSHQWRQPFPEKERWHLGHQTVSNWGLRSILVPWDHLLWVLNLKSIG